MRFGALKALLKTTSLSGNRLERSCTRRRLDVRRTRASNASQTILECVAPTRVAQIPSRQAATGSRVVSRETQRPGFSAVTTTGAIDANARVERGAGRKSHLQRDVIDLFRAGKRFLHSSVRSRGGEDEHTVGQRVTLEGLDQGCGHRTASARATVARADRSRECTYLDVIERPFAEELHFLRRRHGASQKRLRKADPASEEEKKKQRDGAEAVTLSRRFNTQR